MVNLDRSTHGPADGRFRFWWGCLVAAAIAVLLFGLCLVLLPGLTRAALNLMFYASVQGHPSFSPEAHAYLRLVYAVLGAVMIGWAVALLGMLLGPFRRRESIGWSVVACSIAAWFVPDTAVSLWSGFWQNVVFNLMFVAAFGLPLAATRRHFRGGASGPLSG